MVTSVEKCNFIVTTVKILFMMFKLFVFNRTNLVAFQNFHHICTIIWTDVSIVCAFDVLHIEGSSPHAVAVSRMSFHKLFQCSMK